MCVRSFVLKFPLMGERDDVGNVRSGNPDIFLEIVANIFFHCSSFHFPILCLVRLVDTDWNLKGTHEPCIKSNEICNNMFAKVPNSKTSIAAGKNSYTNLTLGNLSKTPFVHSPRACVSTPTWKLLPVLVVLMVEITSKLRAIPVYHQKDSRLPPDEESEDACK